MVSLRFGSRPRVRTVLALFLLPLGLASCEDRIFGMPSSRFAEVLERGETEAILSLDVRELADPGPAGPEAYYYLGRWLEERLPSAPPESDAGPSASGAESADESSALPPGLSDTAEPPPPLVSEAPRAGGLVVELYRLALRRTKGLVQAEAGQALLRLLQDEAQARPSDTPEAKTAWENLLDASVLADSLLGAEWGRNRCRLAAFEALGRDAELLRAVAELRISFPGEAKKNEAELLYYEAAASLRLGRKAWPELAGKLLALPGSAWTGRALAALDAAGGGAVNRLSPELLASARLRAALWSKDYAAGYVALQGILPLLQSIDADPSLVADAGKVFLYAAKIPEGLIAFQGMAPQSGNSTREKSRVWNGSFYRARFLRGLERWDEAAALFGDLVPRAPRAEDHDAALWYAADCRISSARAVLATANKLGKREEQKAGEVFRRTALAALRDAALIWKDSAQFSDLADVLLRESLGAKDWGLVEDFVLDLGPHLSPGLAIRGGYIAARARELGYLPASASSRNGAKTSADGAAATVPAGAEELYRSIANASGASPYYRILAARRLGIELELLPPESPETTSATTGPADPAAGGAEESGELFRFLEGFFDYRLGNLVYAEAASRLKSLSPEELRSLAVALARGGCYADSMRVILVLMSRSDWEPRRSDYELAYPRPFIDELRAIRPRPITPEYILFGLIRSESFFRSEVVSRAGAVGLSQLMPGTAAEAARKIGLASYDLAEPADNLKIGTAYFGELLEATGGRPLRAMFAYNAGRGRLWRWLDELGDLPEDLLLEALPFEETRQYGRNILQASVYYGSLYYEKTAKEVVDEILGGLSVSRR